MKYIKWQILEISWVDSLADSGWKNGKDFILDEQMLDHKTIGYFVGETKRSIAVVQSLSLGVGKYSGAHNFDAVMQIPKVAITKIRTLK